MSAIRQADQDIFPGWWTYSVEPLSSLCPRHLQTDELRRQEILMDIALVNFKGKQPFKATVPSTFW